MGWFGGGIIGIFLGLLVETGLFFIAHFCQLFLGRGSSFCGLFIVPFDLIANMVSFSERINYTISIIIYLVLFFVIGTVIFRKINEI